VVSISVTALLPIVLFPLTGALSLGETTASFVHRCIFPYIGGGAADRCQLVERQPGH
jgi:sodium-dependent dicarboxylate transporter 2/3/5